MNVDFMILGAQKCATSTLFEILSRHPSIVGCSVKEPHFFSTAKDWRGELPRYEALFPQRAGAFYLEASTSYTFYPHRNLQIWNALFEYNPQLKFIYIVRDPVARIVSNYVHQVARGYTTDSIEVAIRRHPLLLDATRYYTQIIPFIRTFGREQVLLVDFDDLVGQVRATLERITGFLQIDLKGLGDFERVHANKSVGERKRHHTFDNPSLVLRGVRRLMPRVWTSLMRLRGPQVTGKPELSAALKHSITDLLELEISATEALLGKSLAHWRHHLPSAVETAVTAEVSLHFARPQCSDTSNRPTLAR